MVLDDERAHTVRTRCPHFRDIGLSLALPGVDARRVHVKVHVDGAFEQPGAVSFQN
jgi:hypothetical protein